jgi:thiol-disulfide isomerase/thioredoxin
VFAGATSTAQTGDKSGNSVDYHEAGAPMPAIKLVTFDSVEYKLTAKEKKDRKKNNLPAATHLKKPRILTEKDFDNKGNLMVMMFNPTCGHCEDQTDQIARNATLFTEGGKDTRVILMANMNMRTYLPDFIKNHKVNQFPVFTIGMDSADFIKESFLYSSLPQINIYDQNRKLLKIFTGEVRMDSLIQFIK